MSTDLIIRPATHADIDAVLGFWLLAAEASDRQDDARSIRALIDRDAAALQLAESDGLLVGSVIAGWDGWRCHLYRLAVHPDRRGEGIARVMVARCEERFTELTALRVDAMVLDNNQLGWSFWASAGYRRQDDWSRWTKPLGQEPGR